MDHRKLGAVETRFAELIWANAPISSGDLVKLCQKELEWKKSTTYTVLKKLCGEGLFSNRDGLVEAVMSRDEFYAMESELFVQENFSGSLPAFLAAFTARKPLTDGEIRQLQDMIRNMGGQNNE